MAKLLWLDEYERTARAAPGLIALLPVPILITAFGLRHNPVIAVVVSLLTAVGGPLVLAKYVRSRGKSLETRLYQRWGGPPTMLLLSPPSSGPPDAIQLQRRTNTERVTGQVLPVTPLPNSDGDARIYLAAVSTLRQKTYDHAAFPMIFAENKGYGFERNVLAIRSEGLALSGSGLLIAAGGWGLAGSGHLKTSSSALAVATVITLLVVIFWVLWPTERRVRQAGDLYAEQLLDAAAAL